MATVRFPKYSADIAFAAWKDAVDIHLLKLCGMNADDIPDHCYRSDWQSHMTPEQSAKRAIKRAKQF